MIHPHRWGWNPPNPPNPCALTHSQGAATRAPVGVLSNLMVNTAVLIGSEHCNSYSLLLCSTPPRPSASRVPFSSSSHMLPGPSTVHLPSPFKKWSTASSRQGASGTRHCGEYSAAALSSIPSSNEQYHLDERFKSGCRVPQENHSEDGDLLLSLKGICIPYKMHYSSSLLTQEVPAKCQNRSEPVRKS